LIVGLEKIDYGEIFIDNEKLLYERDKLYKIRKKTGIVFQESNKHIIGETVAESLIFGMENNRIPLEKMKKNMSKYIKLFQLEDIINKKIVNLSGGEKQKVALAGAVITEPDIILLDEITEMWDKITKDKMNGIIENFLRNGKTVVSVTHNSEEIRKSGNVVFITEEKKIITGKFDEISQMIQKDKNEEISHKMISEYYADLKETSIKEENIKIKIENVSYYYEKERNVIDNFSVNIPKDSIIAITGKSGAGKTTLIEIMSGLIFLGENFSGEIEYRFRSENTENEKLLLYKNISEKDLSEIRKRMGIVFQNTGEQFFSGTVQEELEYNMDDNLKRRCAKMLKALSENDKETIKSMFSKKVKKRKELDKEIDKAMEFFEGKVLEYDSYVSGGDEVSVDNGKITFFTLSIQIESVKTDKNKTYVIVGLYYVVNDKDPDSIGLRYISIYDYSNREPYDLNAPSVDVGDTNF